MNRKFWLAMAILVPMVPAQAKDKTTLLFSSNDTIQVTIAGPINTLRKRQEREPEPYPATLTVAGGWAETRAIDLSARGNSRRNKDNCRFPPLRVRFQEKPGKGSLFHKQRSLKVVTHCRRKESFQQYLLLEYTAYRLLNAITDVSFRVRLADISYVDDATGKEIVRRQGFFIEDVDDVAKRLGKKEVDTGEIHQSQLLGDAMGTLMLFQYMIGNADFSTLTGPPGEDCCHNSKLIGVDANARTGLLPVPYDFDNAGLVNAPYAIPPEGLGLSNIRQRIFRGICIHNSDSVRAVPLFHDHREAFFHVIDTTPGLTDRTRKKAKKYLNAFYDDIADPQSVEKNLLSDCRS